MSILLIMAFILQKNLKADKKNRNVAAYTTEKETTDSRELCSH